MENKINQYLIEQGIKPKHKGFTYLALAIKLRLEAKEPITISKIYDGVAKEFGISSANVERCIRGALDAAWKGKGKRPSNGDFIANAAIMLKVK